MPRIITKMTLNPSLAAVLLIKENIINVIQNHALPVSARAACIGPQLAIVNQWADQIPLVLDNLEAPAPVNIIFAIRKELFTAPQFVHCILNIPAVDLPSSFATFLAMILKLIGAQKTDKERPMTRVRYLIFLFYL